MLLLLFMLERHVRCDLSGTVLRKFSVVLNVSNSIGTSTIRKYQEQHIMLSIFMALICAWDILSILC